MSKMANTTKQDTLNAEIETAISVAVQHAMRSAKEDLVRHIDYRSVVLGKALVESVRITMPGITRGIVRDQDRQIRASLDEYITPLVEPIKAMEADAREARAARRAREARRNLWLVAREEFTYWYVTLGVFSIGALCGAFIYSQFH